METPRVDSGLRLRKVMIQVVRIQGLAYFAERFDAEVTGVLRVLAI